MGPYTLPRCSRLNMRTMANQKIGRWRRDFHTVRGGIMYVWMDSDPLLCPGDAYFVYESRPVRDQTKLTCFIFV